MFLWMYGNSISGTLPTEFPGGLTTGGSLWFDITDNALTGTIPPEAGGFTAPNGADCYFTKGYKEAA